MTENKKYCMGCMKEIDLECTVCPHCNYNSETVQHSPCLPKESLISNRYLIGKAISISNDSVTYIGIDKQTEEIVSVHEFFPVKIVDRAEGETEVTVKLGYDAMFRNCLQSFISMWKGIGSVEGEIALPEVRNILDYNGTVYAVCKYIDSITLKAFFQETKKPLPWQKAYSAFRGILTALSKLHSVGVVHGGISPSSVHVGSDGKLHLTSFSIPQCHSQVDALNVAPINGFSPIELYGEEKSADKCSDVYSVMSLIYYSVTGIVPPKATERAVRDEMVIPSSVAATLPKKVISAFIKGLAVYPENRIKDADELIEAIAPANQPKTEVRTAPSQTPSSKTVTKNAPTTEKKKIPAVKKEKLPEPKKNKKKSETSLVTLALGTFGVVVVFCMVVFSVLYTTVLYKNYDIPVLNKAFSSFSFLPMNKNQPVIDDITEPSTEEATQAFQGNSYVTVPDFTAHTYDSITSNDTFNNNFDIKFTFEYNEKVKKNAVISQDLTKGESVLAGSVVNIVISRGAEQIELPEVIGLKFSDAKTELEALGFVVKKEVLENDGSHEENIVEMTDKVAGLEFDKGTEIVLSVWDKAPEEDTTEVEKTKKNQKVDNVVVEE